MNEIIQSEIKSVKYPYVKRFEMPNIPLLPMPFLMCPLKLVGFCLFNWLNPPNTYPLVMELATSAGTVLQRVCIQGFNSGLYCNFNFDYQQYVGTAVDDIRLNLISGVYNGGMHIEIFYIDDIVDTER